MRIHRVWKKGNSSLERSMWEYSDERWELQTTGLIYHYRVEQRWKEQEEIHERLEMLPESPIPLEALSPHVIGSEWVWEEFEEPALEFQQESSFDTIQAKMVSTSKVQLVSTPPPPVVPSGDQISHEQLKQLNQESQAILSSQPSYNLPTELWCSLSQWIPPFALFQPSLHLQAASELSDTPTPTFPVQSKRGTYLQPGRPQRPYAKRDLPTKHAHLNKPLPFVKEQVPLFI